MLFLMLFRIIYFKIFSKIGTNKRIKYINLLKTLKRININDL
jgi:hypothetical protein